MFNFHDFLLMRTLERKYESVSSNSDSALLLAGGDGDEITTDELLEALKLVQVCAKLPKHLSDRIDQCSALLGCTKREFIELAMAKACDDALEIARDVGLLKGENKGENA